MDSNAVAKDAIGAAIKKMPLALKAKIAAGVGLAFVLLIVIIVLIAYLLDIYATIDAMFAPITGLIDKNPGIYNISERTGISPEDTAVYFALRFPNGDIPEWVDSNYSMDFENESKKAAVYLEIVNFMYEMTLDFNYNRCDKVVLFVDTCKIPLVSDIAAAQAQAALSLDLAAAFLGWQSVSVKELNDLLNWDSAIAEGATELFGDNFFTDSLEFTSDFWHKSYIYTDSLEVMADRVYDKSQTKSNYLPTKRTWPNKKNYDKFVVDANKYTLDTYLNGVAGTFFPVSTETFDLANPEIIYNDSIVWPVARVKAVTDLNGASYDDGYNSITSRFGWRASTGTYHHGVDIGGGNQTVYAALSGWVINTRNNYTGLGQYSKDSEGNLTYTGPDGGKMGNYIVFKTPVFDDSGKNIGYIKTTYMHLLMMTSEVISISATQDNTLMAMNRDEYEQFMISNSSSQSYVIEGDRVAVLGNSGFSTGAHLHFQFQYNIPGSNISLDSLGYRNPLNIPIRKYIYRE